VASEIAERNRRIVERFLTEGVLGGRFDVFDELCDPGVINHAAAPQAREGIDALKRVIGFSRTAMPDQRWNDRVIVADEEYVVVRAVRESTWSAESFRGIATPQGVMTAVEMVHIWRLVDSKIVEHWAVRDDLGLMMQLGVVESG
jgi:predicted ester cyclase